MKAFGSKTPKRTVVYANTRHIKQLDCGPMKREALTSSVRTTKTYMSKKGQKRFSGSENLKGTQFLDTYHLGNYDVFFLNCTFLLNLGVCWWWAPKRTKSIGQVFVGLRLYPWQYIKKIMELYRDAKTEERDAFPAVPQQMAMDMVLYLHSGCWWYLMLLHIWVVGNH